ncbi:MAG: hypothetical protein AAGI15_14490 [Pseudomonadota bacterium]
MNSKDALPEGFGHEIYGPGKQFFDNAVLDNIMDAMLELTAALWTVQDRNLVLEQVLQEALQQDAQARADFDLQARIEDFRPDEALQARRLAAREELVKTVFGGFARKSEPQLKTNDR